MDRVPAGPLVDGAVPFDGRAAGWRGAGMNQPSFVGAG